MLDTQVGELIDQPPCSAICVVSMALYPPDVRYSLLDDDPEA
jgi:hypothetical protein